MIILKIKLDSQIVRKGCVSWTQIVPFIMVLFYFTSEIRVKTEITDTESDSDTDLFCSESVSSVVVSVTFRSKPETLLVTKF